VLVFQLTELPRPVIRHLSGLWRRRWTVITVTWMAALLGWFAVWLVPDKYESRAHVFVQTETVLEPVLSGLTVKPDYSRRVEVMRLQLLTRPNVEKVIFRSGLEETIEARSTIERRAKLEGMIEWVAGQIKIESPRDMYFIISYKNSDPEIARAVVDAVLTMLIEQDLGASLSENEAARRLLSLQIEEYDEKLTANESKVAAFRREHAVELTASRNAGGQREQKESELVLVRDELERTKGRILILENLIASTPPTTSGGELDTLRVELSDLRSRYQESHPDVRGLLLRIAQMENDGGGAMSANPEFTRLQSELSIARNSVRVLEGRALRLKEGLDSLDVVAGDAPATEAALRQIIREYEQTQKTYEALLARRDRMDLTRNLGIGSLGVEYQVFEYPQKALTPTDPSRLLLIIGVFIIAAGAGAGAAFLLTMFDKSYSQLSELKEAFGLPVLGAVSEVRSESVMAERHQDFKYLAGAVAGLFLVGAMYAYFSVYKLPVDLDGATEWASDEYMSKGAS